MNFRLNKIRRETEKLNTGEGRRKKIKELNKVETKLEIIQDNIFPYYTFHYILLRDYYQKGEKQIINKV